MPSLIFIVEDEIDLVSTLEYNIQRQGFQTRSATTGAQALAAISADPLPDLVILDLMLPDMDGFDVCKQIRMSERTREVPVLMLTAKSDEIDRVVGFEVGADDYVVKPFSVRELMLRIRAILRRVGAPAPVGGLLSFCRLAVDVAGHVARVDDEEIHLTALEFKLLRTLLERKGRVQSREMLLSDVWGIDVNVTTRTVDTHVKRLRLKLGPAGGYIETIRGVGYRFRSKVEGEGS